MQEFSIGEWVKRRMDGKIGRVVKVDTYDGQFAYYVDLDAEGRRGKPSDDDLWAGTTGAWERATNLHAHQQRESSDCDGRYSSGCIYEMTLEERCDQFGDLRFKDRVLAATVSVIGHGTLTVTPETLDWSERTEEGGVWTQIVWCEDNCEGRTWQRDHRAEAAGY